jgi:hypothetical protein
MTLMVSTLACLIMTAGANSPAPANAPAAMTAVAPGIWKFTVGTPEKITPVSVRGVPPKFRFPDPGGDLGRFVGNGVGTLSIRNIS